MLVGNSMGCQIIADVAVRHPERVKRIVLQGPTMDPRGRTVLQQVTRLLINIPREPFSFVPVMLIDYLDAGTGRAWRTFRYALRDRIEESLPHVRVPALVVRGSHDPLVSQRWAEEVTQLLSKGRLVVIPGSAHVANFDAPSEFVRVVRSFLREEQ